MSGLLLHTVKGIKANHARMAARKVSKARRSTLISAGLGGRVWYRPELDAVVLADFDAVLASVLVAVVETLELPETVAVLLALLVAVLVAELDCVADPVVVPVVDAELDLELVPEVVIVVEAERVAVVLPEELADVLAEVDSDALALLVAVLDPVSLAVEVWVVVTVLVSEVEALDVALLEADKLADDVALEVRVVLGLVTSQVKEPSSTALITPFITPAARIQSTLLSTKRYRLRTQPTVKISPGNCVCSRTIADKAAAVPSHVPAPSPRKKPLPSLAGIHSICPEAYSTPARKRRAVRQ